MYYSDTYILVKQTITNTEGQLDGTDANKRRDERNKRVKFKNCARFTDWISKINNTQVHTAKNLDVIMPMHNSIEHSDDYSKTSESL